MLLYYNTICERKDVLFFSFIKYIYNTLNFYAYFRIHILGEFGIILQEQNFKFFSINLFYLYRHAKCKRNAAQNILA